MMTPLGVVVVAVDAITALQRKQKGNGGSGERSGEFKAMYDVEHL